MQFKKFWGMYCLGLILFIILVLIFKNLKVDAYDPQSELYPRTHEVDCIELTLEDAQLLMRIADAESHNQGADGEWLVMSVVLNRVDSPEFPDNIHDVVYQEYQFYTKGMKSEISPEAHEALARIEKGDVAPQIIGFEKSTSKFLEKYFCSAFDYRDHTFYTLKK